MIWLLILGFLIFMVFLYVNGIDDMNREYPNYKGEDFLDQDIEKKVWDDNCVHTESDF